MCSFVGIFLTQFGAELICLTFPLWCAQTGFGCLVFAGFAGRFGCSALSPGFQNYSRSTRNFQAATREFAYLKHQPRFNYAAADFRPATEKSADLTVNAADLKVLSPPKQQKSASRQILNQFQLDFAIK
ncbi:Hypothetical_protein [Hexamita inflata]|uniref:Hypothetical_protein n=1 Tax=Hexamita inflata TaxID=28002 RepID=A0AA86NVB3_9EUKA|nr:Hypothetical protein HINF_LOCUS13462 [Hexamita inflata]